MAKNTRDLAILLLEGGCSRLFLPPATGEELYTFLEMCRENKASRQHVSPSSKLDTLWHWMLLNTDVSTCVHEALGGIVPHSTSTESDSLEKKNKRRRLSMKLMTSMGYSPNPELWDEDSRQGEEQKRNNGDSCYEGDLSNGHRSRRRGSSIQSHISLSGRKKEKTFRVNVRTLTGKYIVVDGLSASTTVERLVSALENTEGIPQDKQVLAYEGRRLCRYRTLEESDVVHDATIDLFVEQSGC
ncbi:hypothetical protein M9434_000140 [Picochlorum sp. BPE23]|nr:hypothetical protein M9434_000140 [Picochlorum sp. BPE23]